MQRLDEFRIFYNHTIHPELMRLEHKRKRLLTFIFLSVIFIIGILVVEVYVGILAVTLLLMMLIGFYIAYLVYQVRKFIATFKPQVIGLILDFIDDGVNYGTLKYASDKAVSKNFFMKSQIFASPAQQYLGEDYISGKIGELDFELCELNVREFSRVRNRLSYVFKGIFMRTTFRTPLRGAILILPREFRQYLSRSIREFVRQGGREVEGAISNETFQSYFMTYATPDAPVYEVLSPHMQQTIVEYKQTTDKELYFSFMGNEIYIAITEPKDILEPHVWQSNVSFELVKEFFEDLLMLFNIVEDFDTNH